MTIGLPDYGKRDATVGRADTPGGATARADVFVWPKRAPNNTLT